MRLRNAFKPSILALLLVSLVAANPAAAQTSQFKVLHVFTRGTDGAYPSALAVDTSGNLFGTTVQGGDLSACSTAGCGNVFELSQLNGHWGERVLADFSWNEGLPQPVGPLVVDAKGNVYGATTEGGDPSCNCGEVFQLTRSGGVWTLNVLHTFLGAYSDGQNPVSGLVQDSAGNIYGATEQGGMYGPGSIFELSPATGGSWTFSIIHSFGLAGDGGDPYGPISIDASGNLYGTTTGGGFFGYGTVFKFALNNGTWTESTLYNFTLDYGMFQQPDGVVLGPDGNLYGATIFGGEFSLGTIYKLSPTNGLWSRTVLHTFSGDNDGAYPYGGLTVGPTGILYGTTGYGGLYGYGTVYKLVKGAHGQWNQAILHNFLGTDGGQPSAGVVLDHSGNVYGVAVDGGADGGGTAFEIVMP
jgi:uncharacterized repeat protein (TIGR03803 family)